MFIEDDSGEFDWPVDVKKPISGGRFKTERFTARFRTVDEEEQAAINDLPITRNNAAQARACWIGWGEDVRDAAKEPIPYDEEVRDRLLGRPYVAAAVVGAYWDAMSGKKAARKN